MDENAEQQQDDAEGGLGEDGALEECCVLHEWRIELAEVPRRAAEHHEDPCPDQQIAPLSL